MPTTPPLRLRLLYFVHTHGLLPTCSRKLALASHVLSLRYGPAPRIVLEITPVQAARELVKTHGYGTLALLPPRGHGSSFGSTVSLQEPIRSM